MKDVNDFSKCELCGSEEVGNNANQTYITPTDADYIMLPIRLSWLRPICLLCLKKVVANCYKEEPDQYGFRRVKVDLGTEK